MEMLGIFITGVVIGSVLTGMFFDWLHRDKLEELRSIKAQISRKHW